MAKEIDARNMACPQPVLCAKDAIDQEGPESLSVLVDNEAASENVSRFMKSQGYEVRVEPRGADFLVSGARSGAPPAPEPSHAPAAAAEGDQPRKIMVMCTSDRMGRGDDGLGERLMVNFIRTLGEMGGELWRLVFVNSGVKLAVEGSEVIPELKKYEEAGLTILVCGTCLDHFRLLDKKQAGVTTNMLDIVTAMQLADSVINL